MNNGNWNDMLVEIFNRIQPVAYTQPLDWSAYGDPGFDFQRTLEEIELRDSYNVDE